MKASIRDGAALDTIVPVDTAAYLRTRGWREVEHKDLRYAVWAFSHDGEGFEILLPLDRTFRDYALRMGEILSTLELVERRSQLEILHDITTTFADVIRIRSQQDGTKDGSLPLAGGVSLVEKLAGPLACRGLLHGLQTCLLPNSQAVRGDPVR